MEYLQVNRVGSALKLSRALGMTAANVRHHLGALTTRGLVDAVGQTKAQGRGRPTLLYMASKQSQDHSLGELASVLFEQILGARDSQRRQRGLARAAAKLAAGAGQAGATITQRLVAAVERLNNLRYRAHWEAHAQAPRVIFAQCPFAAIIERHPELCQMDAYLLESLLDEPVTQTSKIARSPQGPAVCVFLVGD